jgi:putative NIF3 family GTP cyclohydrolase 1 type 2
MKLFKLYFLLLIVTRLQIPAIQSSQVQTTAREVIQQMKSHLTCEWSNETVDTFKSGNPDDVVTGIAVSMFADMATLRKAVENKCNLIVVHEPTFYNHLDQTDGLVNDPVYRKKNEYIAKHKLIIFRFHDHWHKAAPDGIYRGMIDKLGWKANQTDSSMVFFKFDEQTVGEFAKKLQEKFKDSQFRIVGDPSMRFTKVALAVGAPGSENHIKLLSGEKSELLIAGEAPEWETYEYVLDASLLGMKKAAIFTGHIASEEAGMNYCAKWLKTFIKDIPIIYLENGSSFRAVQQPLNP